MDLALPVFSWLLTLLFLGYAFKGLLRGEIAHFLTIVTILTCCHICLAPHCGNERLLGWLRDRDLPSAFFQNLGELKEIIRSLFC